MTQDDPRWPKMILMISLWYLMIFKLTGPWNPWNKLCKLLGQVGQNLTSPETLRAFGPWPWPKLIGLIFANMSSLRMHGHVATSEYMMTIDDKFRDRLQKLCISMHIFACLFLSRILFTKTTFDPWWSKRHLRELLDVRHGIASRCQDVDEPQHAAGLQITARKVGWYAVECPTDPYSHS